MKRSVGPVFVLLCLVFSSLVLAPAAEAQNTVYVASARSASSVINGSVVSVTNVELDGMPLTVHEIAVSDVVFGDVPETVYVYIPGGQRSDGAIVMVSTSADFLEVDETVQLALTPARDAVATTVALSTGTSAPVFSIAGGDRGVAGISPSGIVVDRGASDFSFNGNARPSFIPPARYQVNPGNSGLSSALTIAAVRAGFDRWENDPASVIDFTYQGTTRQVGLNNTYGNGVVDVYWEWPNNVNNFEDSTLAATYWIRNDGADWEFDIIFNRAFQWTAGVSRNAIDIETVMAHEVGHGIGLGHVNAQEELMYPDISAGTKALGVGDRNGARTLYPVPSETKEPGHSTDANVDGDVALVALKSNGLLYARRDLGRGWSAWQPLGIGGWASADVTISPNGTIHVAAIKKDGRLYTNRWNTSGTWAGWIGHGGGWDPSTNPSISSNASRAFLAAIDRSGLLQTKLFTGSWSGATTHGLGGWAHVDVDIAADGDLWFVGVKNDGRLYLRKHLGRSWSGFAEMGLPNWSASTPPAVAARSNGVVFGAVKRDGRLFTREQINSRWAAYVGHGLSQWSSIDVAMNERGATWLAAHKSWGRLYTRARSSGAAWSRWGIQGADTWAPLADASISIGANNQPVLLAVKQAQLLYFRPRTTSGWGNWVLLGAGQWSSGSPR